MASVLEAVIEAVRPSPASAATPPRPSADDLIQRARGLLPLLEPRVVNGLEHRLLGAQVVAAVEHQMPP